MKLLYKDHSPMVSVIVPIYNSVMYIEKCLESIKNQSYKNIEVIMINDGSTDGSEQIAYKYVNEDNRFIIINKANMGVSAARNDGIELASGEFLTFIDSDDIIDKEFIETLLSAMVEDVDIAVCNMKYVSDSVGEVKHIQTSCDRDTVISIDNTYCFQRGLQHLSACAALYRREIVVDSRFDTSITVGEDALFHNGVFVRCRKVAFINKKLYTYVMHDDSAFKKGFTEKRMTEITAWRKIVLIYTGYPLARDSAKGELAIRCMSIYKLICKVKKELNEYGNYTLDLFRENYRFIRCCNPGRKVILESVLLKISPRLFRLVYRFKTK